ncbi:OLC1v1032831C1 [Oldenlandia corymbosa var. corymbosa]|uniref:OLC1v1032831C1 n=1 Tax=Oldenlandia corymbosa var. corymbosa TaxID=529605 RepID=A0AAV1CPL5_OLDCO|nr:OLC1v1032831C1 [Oldenlandia corymbosa var. corymbosa]
MQMMHLLEQQPLGNGDFVMPRRSFQKKKLKKNGSLLSLPSSTSSSLLLIVDSFSRKSFSYDKLPQEPLKLTVIKLDGTSFEIEVVKTGNLGLLKRAVEAVFSHLPKTGPRKVSWPFVWGHFCLCYDGKKLLNDTDEIASYGIQDGDKLHFIRHVSTTYNLAKERSEEEDVEFDEPPILDAWEDKYLQWPKVDRYKYTQRDIESQQDVYQVDSEDSMQHSATNCRYNLVDLFRGWFSYRKLPTSDVRTDEHNSYPSRLSFSSRLGSFKDVVIYTG